MNKEDIVRMAREAGLITQFDCTTPWVGDYDLTPHLERFAALVSDAAKLEMLMAGHDEWLEEARKAEREACAKVCEGRLQHGLNFEGCAAAIRARSNT